MMLEDWLIVLVLVLSVLGGLSQGFFRSVFSLGGLVIGLAVAAWNYGRIAALLTPFIKVEAVSNAIGFIVIALVIMGLAGLTGIGFHKAFHKMGLGCLDRLAGAGFGFLQGVLLVTLCILVAVAFFPEAHWLVEARLPRLFFGACHLSTHMTPSDLADRVRRGLSLLEQESPWWLHPGTGKP
jgi:membrane protein required for colicin V production